MRPVAGSQLPPYAFFLGLFSLLAQSVLLREFFVVFSGSELTLGLVLAAWLLWNGAGSALGGRLLRILPPEAEPRRLLPVLEAAAVLTFPAAILLVRLTRIIVPASTGELLSLGTTILFAYAALGLPGLAFGLWFTLAAATTPREGAGPGRVYAWEAVGALCGGVVFSFVLAERMEGLQLGLILALLAAAVACVSTAGGSPGPRNFLAAATAAAGALALGLLPPGAIPLVQRSQAWRWPGMEVVDSRDTRYGNLALIRVGSQKTIFHNGVPGASFPDPLAPSETVHLPLLAAPLRREVLIVGGGLGGGLAEVLRYPVERVDYLEIDPEVLRLVRDRLPEEYVAPMEDPRVRVLHVDGRAWLERRTSRYDVILLHLPPPATAQINRYYTREFFLLAREGLKETGLLALSLPASPNYFSQALRLRNGSVFQTLEEVFTSVAAVQAGRNHFFATGSDGGLDLSRERIGRAVKELGVESDQLKPEVVAAFLDPDRSAFLRGELTGEDSARNSDTSPAAYYYTALFTSGLRDPSLSPWLRAALGPGRVLPFLLPLLLLLSGPAAARLFPAKGIPLGTAAFASGSAAMISQYLVLFTYQTARGLLYRQIGVLNGAFMAGVAGGGFICLHGRGPSPRHRRWLLLSESALLLWPLLLALALQALLGSSFGVTGPLHVDGLFLLLSFLSGLFVGFQFPLFALAHGEESAEAAAVGGRYYFLDLAGSAVGVLLASVWLLPLVGVGGALLFCFLLKCASFLTVIVGRRT